jgi:glycosyltransferase involved in cell wall biosynthesis
MFWIDVTDTFLNWSGSPTGIQRTLLGLAEASKQRDDCALCAWDREKNLWREIPVDHFTPIFSKDSPCAEDNGPVSSKPVEISEARVIFNFFRILSQDCFLGVNNLLYQVSPFCLIKIYERWKKNTKTREKSFSKPIFYQSKINIKKSGLELKILTTRNKFLTTLLKWVMYISPNYIVRRWWDYSRPKDTVAKQVKSVNQELVRREILSKFTPIISWGLGDSILLADSLWNQPGFLNALSASEKPPSIIGFCYDIIPIDRPDFVIEPARIIFKEWLMEMLAHSQEVVCISRYSAQRLKDFVLWESLHLPSLKSIRPIAFGNMIEDKLSDENRPSKTLGDILMAHKLHSGVCSEQNLQATSWLLWLGSIDVRKNLDVLLLALEYLISDGKCNRPVVIAGRPSTGFNYYEAKIRNNPVLKKNIILIVAPSDELVKDLQTGTALSLFTSWEEGYGLPVAEFLQAGIPVIASNATSIPEVAGDLVDYFEPWDSRGLAELIDRFEANEEYRDELLARASKFVATSWNKTLDDIVQN